MRHIQLEEPDTTRIRLAHIFDRLTTSSTETVWEIELSSYFCNRQFTGRVVDLVYSNGRESDWCGDGVAETGPGCVAVVCVDEHSGDDSVAVEGLSVCGVCCRLSRIGGGVEPAALGELFFGEVFEFSRFCGREK